jgi:uncharacterized protein (TIGR03086 family)
MLDLEPATELVKELLSGVSDDDLVRPTPCEAMDVATLLDHLHGLAIAFRDAGTKQIPEGGSQAPEPSADGLPTDWRTQLPARLDELALAWSRPEAHEGMTEAGGVQMPGEVAAGVALDEVVMHGWDLAKATGQSFLPDDATARGVLAFTTEAAQPEWADMRNNIFGPIVQVDDNASDFDRALGLAGRNPAWTP